MNRLVRFSSLVRKGLRFRRTFEQAKRLADPQTFEWYPYDCFANLFYIQHLLSRTGLSLQDVISAKPVLDAGAADGALSFFLESLGYQVHACDYSGTNFNCMKGIRILAGVLKSKVLIHDVNLDEGTGFSSIAVEYGAALFLGTLYHLKNPFLVLEMLATKARYCFLSTKVARLSSGRKLSFEQEPVAYLLEADECNSDATNYWIFSPAGLRVLVKRAGWIIRAEANSGATESDPISKEGDERMFLLLERTDPCNGSRPIFS